MKRRYNYRLGGGDQVGEPYLIVTKPPFPEIHWQVPHWDLQWVRNELDLTNWHDPERFAEMLQRLQQFEASELNRRRLALERIEKLGRCAMRLSEMTADELEQVASFLENGGREGHGGGDSSEGV